MNQTEATEQIQTIAWIGDCDGCLQLIDQTLLPGELKYIKCHDVESVWEAIKMLRVRGAPAIGIAAAYGVVIGIQNVDRPELPRRAMEVAQYLSTSRPTAVNLFWRWTE